MILERQTYTSDTQTSLARVRYSSDATPVASNSQPRDTQTSLARVRYSSDATPVASNPQPCDAQTSLARVRYSSDATPVASNPQPRAGFTLLEVILAVTIAGALLAGAATLMVSVTNAWIERQDRHFFEDHVDGVAEFLQACFTVAGSGISLQNSQSGEPNGDESAGGETGGAQITQNEASAGVSLLSTAQDPIDWAQPPGFADYRDPLIHFRLKEPPPLLVQNENAPIVAVEVYLYFEQGEGLSLLWYSPMQEDSEDLNDLRRTPVSDLVTQIEYIYWDLDFEKWETESEPKEGEGDEEYILPRFLKLTFDYEGEIKQRTLTIPVPSRSALIF